MHSLQSYIRQRFDFIITSFCESLTTQKVKEMEATYFISAFIVLLITLVWAWSILNWIWLKPKKLEKLLKEQGLKGNPYRLLVGDIRDLLKIQKEASSKPMNLSDDIVPHVFPFAQQSVAKHGILVFILTLVSNIRKNPNIFNLILN